MTDTNVTGLSELQKLLNTLPSKVEANIVRGALRAGAKVIQEEAKGNVPVDTGQVRDGIKVGTRKRGAQVMATIAVKGRHAFIAPWIEFGTAPHTIPGPLSLGGKVIGSVEHPGTRPRPFMRPALDARAQAAVIEAGEYIKKRLAQKEGLDTAYIMIEGDE